MGAKTESSITLRPSNWILIMDYPGFAYTEDDAYFAYGDNAPNCNGMRISKGNIIDNPEGSKLWGRVTIGTTIVVPNRS